MFRPKLLNIMAKLAPLLLACLLSCAAAAQQPDESEPEPDVEAPETAATDDASTGDAVTDDADETAETVEDIEDIEDADLDEQTYEEDDDDFIPTEEIPADEPIPFPSNI